MRSIFVYGTYLAVKNVVSVVVGSILVDMYKVVGSICPFSIMAV